MPRRIDRNWAIVAPDVAEYIDRLANRGDAALAAVEDQGLKEGWPIVGAAVFTMLQDNVMRETAFWRGLLGAVILLLVLVFPGGIVGALGKRLAARRKRA